MHFFIDFSDRWALKVEYLEANLEHNRSQLPSKTVSIGKKRRVLRAISPKISLDHSPSISRITWMARGSTHKKKSVGAFCPRSLIELEKFLSTGKGDVAFLASEISSSSAQGQTRFFSRVYSELCKVPRGQVITYGELAKRAGNAKASRAVGQAMAKNLFPLIVPCHRVLRADLKLGNYSAPEGARLKQELLKLEGVVCDLV